MLWFRASVMSHLSLYLFLLGQEAAPYKGSQGRVRIIWSVWLREQTLNTLALFLPNVSNLNLLHCPHSFNIKSKGLEMGISRIKCHEMPRRRLGLIIGYAYCGDMVDSHSQIFRTASPMLMVHKSLGIGLHATWRWGNGRGIWTDVSERGTTRSKSLEHTQQDAQASYQSTALGQ